MARFFSTRSRPMHLGPFPLERLTRTAKAPDLSALPVFKSVSMRRPEVPHSIINAMTEYQAMLDALRRGFVSKKISQIPDSPQERTEHLKAFAYFNDACMVGVCAIPAQAHLAQPVVNEDVARLAEQLKTQQTKTLAAGIDVIMAELRENMDAPLTSIAEHRYALVLLNAFPRDPLPDEPGTEWIANAQQARACMLASENAVVLANYLRLLGFDARAHTGTSSDVDHNMLAVAAGLAVCDNDRLQNPYVGDRFGLAVVTTTLELVADQPLASADSQSRWRSHGVAWHSGWGTARNAANHIAYRKRRYVDGPHPFETLKRVAKPTTFIDEQRIPRVPKRTDMFARAQFGDMGKALEDGARNGHYARKSATSMAERYPLGAFVLLQNQSSDVEPDNGTQDAARNSENIKATCYFLGIDAVGVSRCPDWAWYSHDAVGQPISPPHDQAISMIVDQGYETMEGASGDDWISVSQSMRAYLRFALLGGVIARQIRNLGYSAKAHTVLDGEVLQPPLLLLSGLGEVSRIGEVILNPYLGPRLKSGVVTTDMPLSHDKPIDFGLQGFCENCNKCARECPSGAITAGPKLMFNGYEIWKSDSQKCASYRITTQGGAMCGRCMKTCPWNLEGLFTEKPFRWAAMNIPASAPLLARLDDAMNRGGLNPVKKWWWDLERKEDGSYGPARATVNRRDLQKNLKLKYEEQTLAVYPAPLAPHPWPYPFPMDREKGIKAYQSLISAREHKQRIESGDTATLVPGYRVDDESPVIRVEIADVQPMTAATTRYRFQSLDGSDLPVWQAGAHIDIVVAPGFLRQYSMSGDPQNRRYYEVGVQREDNGRGGSVLLQRIFQPGRKVFISRPINHFPVAAEASRHILLGGGIGVTPMIAFAHELHHQGKAFSLHYSVASREDAAYREDIAQFAWSDHVQWHVSSENSRVNFESLLSDYQPGTHIYVCGPDRYITAAVHSAERFGYPPETIHYEYFSVPETPDYENHPFVLKLVKSGREIEIPSDRSASDMLLENGYPVDVKCSDGLCGVCQCALVGGDVEHRDFVLSKAQQKDTIILCQSRAQTAGGVVEIDL